MIKENLNIIEGSELFNHPYLQSFIRQSKDLVYAENKLNLKTSDLAPFKPLKPLRPYKSPFEDEKPCTQEIKCGICGGDMESMNPDKDEVASNVCPNCKAVAEGKVMGLNEHKRDNPGKQYNELSLNNPLYYPKNSPVMLTKADKVIDPNKKINKTKKGLDREFESREFKQLPDIKERKFKKPVDYISEINQTCDDLAIEG